jgi:hypothetical protein
VQVDQPIASLGNAGQKPGGKAEALAPQRIIWIGGTVVNEKRLTYAAKKKKALAAWEDITLLARNEWVVGLSRPKKQKK